MFRIIFAAALLCAPSLAYAETCIASHYGVGDGYGGRRTANGEIMNPRAMTAGTQDAGRLVRALRSQICGWVEPSWSASTTVGHSSVAAASTSATALQRRSAWAGRRGCRSMLASWGMSIIGRSKGMAKRIDVQSGIGEGPEDLKQRAPARATA